MSSRHLTSALLVAALLSTAPLAASAQSAQMISLQFSGLGMYPFGGEMDNIDVGGGWEAQIRLNPSAFSIGGGIENTFHKRLTGQDMVFLGGFLEPRYVLDIGSDNAVLYVSGRAALSQVKIKTANNEATSTGYTLNGGGGLLFRLSDRVNLDAGATLGYKDLGDVTLGAFQVDLGTGANVVARVGLAVGLGS
ncbi:MAG: outer membrane beta-barrel protein [Gemmatimonadales bacterium]